MSAGATVRLLTPEGIGGVAVIELAGPGAADVLAACFRSSGARDVTTDAGRLYRGHIVADGVEVDEALVARLEHEGSTEVFEISGHGGTLPARRIIEALVSRGAYELKGADASGLRLPALEREVYAQLVAARTRRAADVLLTQLSGVLRRALVGAAADARKGRALCATYAYGRRLVTPATVVVTGAPNVGKSTVANALAGRERSIVHHLPGTTRDAVTSVASLGGLPVVLVDTAGLREAADEIERLGVKRALERAARCDLIVWVFDHSRRVTDDETRYLGALAGMPIVPVVNKIDLDGPLDEDRVRALVGGSVQRTCALSGQGIDPLRARMAEILAGGEIPARADPVVTTQTVATALEAENPAAAIQAVLSA